LRIPDSEESTQFFFGPGNVRFHSAERPAQHVGGLLMCEALLVANMEGGLFVAGKLAKRGGEIVTKLGLAGGRSDGFIDRVGHIFLRELALTAAGVAELVVSDAEQPGAKGGAAAKTSDAAIGLKKGFLREVIGPGVVATCELSEKTTHGGLVLPDKFAESLPVIAGENAGDQIMFV
jgi:hypothetical protein